jgi:hypothetical protein
MSESLTESTMNLTLAEIDLILEQLRLIRLEMEAGFDRIDARMNRREVDVSDV